MKFPNPNMLLYIGMADAYGAGAEFLKFPQDESVRERCLAFREYLPHPKGEFAAGSYTDDTEMSLGNAMVLLGCAVPYSRIMFADAWVREFNYGGRRKGYSQRIQTMLERSSNGEEFLALAEKNSGSTWNGAAMRSVPLGVLKTVEDVLAVAELQARITHNTPEGVFSSQAVALMSHFALYERDPLSELKQYCVDFLPKESAILYGSLCMNRWNDSPVTNKPHASVAVTTVWAALDALVRYDSLMDMLRQIIQWGGDTDSVAAITWGVASARYQKEKIPEFMMHNLENGCACTGAVRLMEMGNRLMKKFI